MRLQEHLNAAWAVIDAPAALLPPPTRMGKLEEAARRQACVCGGVWQPGAAFALANNHEDPRVFGRDICRALAVGARRGMNIAIVGEPGSGKSMILQPLEGIFRSMPPPEDGSTFPLSGALDAEILLWQDFEYNPGTLQFNDVLRLLVGERIGVRQPGEKNRSFNNTAPLFYSSLEEIRPSTRGVQPRTYQRKVVAMSERFTIRTWNTPLPMDRRVADFPHCPRCFAAFMLENDAAWHAGHQGLVWL